MIIREIVIYCTPCGALMPFKGPQRSTQAINAFINENTQWRGVGGLHLCPECQAYGYRITKPRKLEDGSTHVAIVEPDPPPEEEPLDP